MSERKQLHRNEFLVPTRRIGDLYGEFERFEDETHDGLRLRELGRRGNYEGRRTKNRHRSVHFVFRRVVFRHVRFRLRGILEKQERLVPELFLNQILLHFVPLV